MFTISAGMLDSIIEEAGNLADVETGDFGVRIRYSGRGMYGKDCIGFVPKDELRGAVLLWTLGHVLYNLSNSEGEDMGWTLSEGDEEFLQTLRNDGAYAVREILASLQKDNMGMGTIYYFPRLTLAEGQDDQVNSLGTDY